MVWCDSTRKAFLQILVIAWFYTLNLWPFYVLRDLCIYVLALLSSIHSLVHSPQKHSEDNLRETVNSLHIILGCRLFILI